MDFRYYVLPGVLLIFRVLGLVLNNSRKVYFKFDVRDWYSAIIRNPITNVESDTKESKVFEPEKKGKKKKGK